MILIYGNYTLSFAISGSAAGSEFLTPSSDMADGRTGTAAALKWISGGQTTSSYVDITVTVSSPLGEVTPMIGGAGLCNVIGLPAGTLVQFRNVAGSKTVSQRLVQGARRELNAWAFPGFASTTLVIRIFNDVNGVASIAASTEFGIGEIVVGRRLCLPTLMGSPSHDMEIGKTYQEKPWRVIESQVGVFSTSQASGGASSNIPSGGNPESVIDVKSVRDILIDSNIFAVCDLASPGLGEGTLIAGTRCRYDQDFMQSNWMPAKLTKPAPLRQDRAPYWTWKPTFEEAI